MITNITAAVLAVVLVVIQLYFIGLYESDPKEVSSISKNLPAMATDKVIFTGKLMEQDTDFLLDYDLSSSPAFSNLENDLK